VRIDGDSPTLIFALAHWDDGAIPRLRAVTFGVDYDPDELEIVEWGSCADFTYADPSWPTPGTGVAVSWSTTRTDTQARVLWFVVQHVGSEPATLSLIPHPTQGAWFADDSVPAKLDAVGAFGVVGFDTPGYPPCPSDALYCCLPDGTCQPMYPSGCAYFQGELIHGPCDDGDNGGPTIPNRIAVLSSPGSYRWSRPFGGEWWNGCPPDHFNLNDATPLVMQSRDGLTRFDREKWRSSPPGYVRPGSSAAVTNGGEVEVRTNELWARDGTVMAWLHPTSLLRERIKMANANGAPRTWVEYSASTAGDTIGVSCLVDSVAQHVRYELLARNGVPPAETRSLSDTGYPLVEAGEYVTYDFEGHVVETNIWSDPAAAPEAGAEGGVDRSMVVLLIGSNPVRDRLRYAIKLSKATAVKVELLAVNGRVEAHIFEGLLDGGEKTLEWSPPLRARPSAGIYYLRASTAGGTSNTRLLWLH